MDISHGGRPATARELLALTGLVATVLIAGIAALRLVGLMVVRLDEYSLTLPFGGWQLYAVAVVIGVVCLALLGLGWWFARRQFRSVRGRTPHHRVAVMAAIVPGLLLGEAIASTVEPALSWASNHTAAHARAEASFVAMERQFRQAPPLRSYRGVAANDPRTRLLLDPTALGRGWSTTITGSIVGLGAPDGELGELRAMLTLRHWADGYWHVDHMTLEKLMTFADAGQTRRYLAEWSGSDVSSCGCAEPTAPSSPTSCGCTSIRRWMVAGAAVTVRTYDSEFGPHHSAAFIFGRHVITLLDAPIAGAVNATPFRALLRAAVARAK